MDLAALEVESKGQPGPSNGVRRLSYDWQEEMKVLKLLFSLQGRREKWVSSNCEQAKQCISTDDQYLKNDPSVRGT